MRYGTVADVKEIRDSGKSDLVLEIEARLLEEKKTNRFSTSLIKIKKELEKLKVNEFLETEEEVRLIRWIENLVHERMTKLVANEFVLAQGFSPSKPKSPPKTIKAALALSDDELAWSVTQVVRGKNKTTLQSKKVTTWLLQRWGINSRGAPRMDFEVVVEGIVERMSAQDIL
jgi:SAM-dependent MidA family methyltransferase